MLAGCCPVIGGVGTFEFSAECQENFSFDGKHIAVGYNIAFADPRDAGSNSCRVN